MMRIIIAATFILALVGCAESAPNKCLRYGFTPHTDGFSNCMLQLENR